MANLVSFPLPSSFLLNNITILLKVFLSKTGFNFQLSFTNVMIVCHIQADTPKSKDTFRSGGFAFLSGLVERGTCVEAKVVKVVR